MTDRKQSKPVAYEVGYRRPPRETQFAPGKSGNQKGRPKGSRSIGAILQDIIQQKVSVTEGGRTRKLPALEVIFRRLTNDAMRTNPQAIRLLLALVERYGESPQTTFGLHTMLDEDQKILAQYLGTPDRLTSEFPLAPNDEGHDHDH